MIVMKGFLIRVAAAFIIVVLTYNPTGYSYFHWVQTGFETNAALTALAGLALAIAYVVLIRATISSIGPFGAGLVAALVGAFVWVLVEWGFIDIENPTVVQWLVILGVSFILGVGLSWSLIRRRLSGQYDLVDDDTPE